MNTENAKTNSSLNEKKWISYDWANSVFATSVVSAFFPIMLRNYWSKGLSSENITLYLGLTNSLISILLFLLLPILGFALDHKIKNPHKTLFKTAVVGGVFTGLLFFVPEGNYTLALTLYTLSFVFFALGNTQCDAMLLKICPHQDSEDLNRLSSMGYLFGYLGGGLLLLLQSLTLIFYKELGFSSPLLPAKLCFLTAGIWWVLFSIPINNIINLENKNLKDKTQGSSILKDLTVFLKSLNKKTVLFLMSFFLYIDVVFTTYKMAVDFGLSMGISRNHLIMVLIYVQVIGVPGTLFMNFISKKFGIKSALYLGLFMFGVVIAASPMVTEIYGFAFLASFIGLSQGGLQALSRSHFAALIENSKHGIAFSFINIFGKLSAVLGPAVVGFSAFILGSNTYSVFTLLPFLILGFYFLKLSFKEDSQ